LRNGKSEINRCDTQYQLVGEVPQLSWLTARVKIEKFQGFSKAYNIDEYFRLRGATSWKSGEQVTGLWKSETKNAYYGDRKTKEGKTLILFFRSPDLESLTVHIFPTGYNPSKKVINQLINELK
jgi:hypothetical protein